MTREQLRENQLSVGAPLPFDIYDSRGVLLMRKGAIITGAAQLERLLESGLYSVDPVPAVASGADAGNIVVRLPGQQVSVVGQLAQARERAVAMLENSDPQTFPVQIQELARTIRAACALDADAAIGNVVASRGLHYPSRHAVNCAGLGFVLLQRQEATDEEIDSCLCALLTMNLSTIDLQLELYTQSAPMSAAQKALNIGHPAHSAALLRERGVTSEAWLDAVMQHHELLDGSGYPAGLKETAIGRHARVMAIADQYCALVSERAFREGVNPCAALRHLLVNQGKGLDSVACALLVRELTAYPPGAAVRLVNGDVGIVCRRTRHPEHPIVRAITSGEGRRYPEPRKRVTSQAAYHIDKPVAQTEIKAFPSAEMLWDDSFANH